MCLSVCLSVSLSGRPCRFLAIICADRNFAQGMQPQATGSNPLSGSIIFPSVRQSVCPVFCPVVCPFVRLVVRGPFAIFLSIFNSFNTIEMITVTITITITSVGVQRHDAFIPTLGSEVPQWGPVNLIFSSVSLYVRMYLCISFLSSSSLFGNHPCSP